MWGVGLATYAPHSTRGTRVTIVQGSVTVDLAALRNKSAQVRFEFDGEWLTFTYNPHAYDDECQRILNQLSDDPDNTALASIFEKLITSWDMRDGTSQVPCTFEAYHNLLPPFLRSKIVNAIVEDEMERGKLRGSANTSNQPRRSGLVPIGSTNSPTSNGQESETGATSST